MDKFRKAVGDSELNEWADNGNDFIAFSRGDIGFFALNRESEGLSGTYKQDCLKATAISR